MQSYQQSYQRKPKRKLSGPLRFFLAVALLAGVSFACAWVWHSMQETRQLAREAEHLQEQALNLSPAEASQAASPGGENQSASAEDAAGGEGEPFPPRPQFTGTVAYSEPVNNSYFDDAIFLGDSISMGIPLYKVLPGVQVVAVAGANPVNAASAALIQTEEGELTLLEAAARYGERSKVYIMLGANGLEAERDEFIAGYREFVRAAKEQYPQAAIYLQSITPVTEQAVEKYAGAQNERIEEFNLAIMALAREQGVYYLDVAAALIDEEGALPRESSPLDGMHLSAECYAKWFEYLRCHTVQAQVSE